MSFFQDALPESLCSCFMGYGLGFRGVSILQKKVVKTFYCEFRVIFIISPNTKFASHKFSGLRKRKYYSNSRGGETKRFTQEWVERRDKLV